MQSGKCGDCIYFTPEEPFTRSERICAKDHELEANDQNSIEQALFGNYKYKLECIDFEREIE